MLRQLRKWVLAGLVAWGLIMVFSRSGDAAKVFYYRDVSGPCGDPCSPPYPPNCDCQH